MTKVTEDNFKVNDSFPEKIKSKARKAIADWSMRSSTNPIPQDENVIVSAGLAYISLTYILDLYAEDQKEQEEKLRKLGTYIDKQDNKLVCAIKRLGKLEDERKECKQNYNNALMECLNQINLNIT